MFTGLFPSEHGVNALTSRLDDRFETIAEILLQEGYQTYLFSANPFVSRASNLSQGFEIQEHPYDEDLVERARETVLAKIDPANIKNPLRGGMRRSRGSEWFVKAVGEIANERLLHFLDERDTTRPFFGFVNYMEAHRIRIPPRRFLEQILGPEAASTAYGFDQSQGRFKRVSLGLTPPFSAEERELIGAIYDATVLELDELLGQLFDQLRSRDLLDSTVVILSSDHGEHLGEKGSYLHQYSLHEGVLSVPLVIWAPRGVPAGREEIPVANIDLFPAVLDFAQVRGHRVSERPSLLRPAADRPVVAEYVEAYGPLLRNLGESDPSFDAAPFLHQLRSLRLGPQKLVWSSSGALELFDLTTDPEEHEDLARVFPERAAELEFLLQGWVDAHGSRLNAEPPKRAITAEEEERLRSLGYL